MEWVSLEGMERVKVSYRVWKQCCRELRKARKDPILKQHKRFLREDMQIEFDELVDSILCLTAKEHATMMETVKSDLLYRLLDTYKN